MRVISLCPSNTEIMEYLGLTSLLVGVDDYSDWPNSIKLLPRLGPDLSINMDLVEQLKPDLVLASLSVPGMEKNVEALNKRKIPHIVLNPQSLCDIENDLIKTAEALHQKEQGLEAVKQFRLRLENVKRNSRRLNKKPIIYWEWWPKPIFTPGKLNWLTELSEAAGGSNLFGDINLASVQTEWEDIVCRQPDFIAIAWVGVRRDKINKEQIKKRTGFEKLTHINDEQILILEEELFCRPSPRLLEGLEKLFKLISH